MDGLPASGVPSEGGDQPPATGKRFADQAAGADPEAKRCATFSKEAAAASGDPADVETIDLKVVFGKGAQTVTRALDSTVLALKQEIEKEIGVPADARMKLLFKGQLRDEQRLRDTGLKNGSKIVVMGSRPAEARAVEAGGGAAAGAAAGEWDAVAKKEAWAELPQHKKVVDKGPPEDAWPGISGRQVPLRDDQTYIPGLLNGQGAKVRLTFRPEIRQLWVGSATHTQKINVASIAKIEAQPIQAHEGYSILRMQLGASASSNFWLYFCPSQAVAGIKMRLLGVASLLE